MNFDLTTVSPLFRGKILKGLMRSNKAAIEETFGTMDVKQSSGKIAFQPSPFSLGNSTEQTAVALNAKASRFDHGLDEASFSIDFKYAMQGRVHVTAVDALAETTADNIVEMTLESAVAKVNTAIDIDGSAYLKNTSVGGVTVNGSKTAAAAWSDATNAKPFTDLDSMFDEIGDADMLWLGLNYARELAALPAVKDEFKHFNGVNSRITMPGLADFLLSHYGHLNEIVIDNNFYNSANPASTAAYSRIFDDVIWAGRKDHFILPEHIKLRKVRTFFDDDTDEYCAEVVRYMSYTRAETKRGCILASA